MRRLLFQIILLLLLLPLFSIEEQKTRFQVVAYKSSPDVNTEAFVRLAVEDATSGEIGVVDSTSGIDLSNKLNGLLSASYKTASHENEHSVFSYRVTGNKVGNYSISVAFANAFYPTGQDSTITTNRIDYSYSLKHKTHSYVDYTTHSAISFTDSGITYALNPLSASGETEKGNTSTTEDRNPLIHNWSFSITDDKEVMEVDSWVVRGIVSMLISSDDYNLATHLGEFTTTAIVTLTYNEGGSS